MVRLRDKLRLKHPFYRTAEGKHVRFRLWMFGILGTIAGASFLLFQVFPGPVDTLPLGIATMVGLLMLIINFLEGDIGALKMEVKELREEVKMW